MCAHQPERRSLAVHHHPRRAARAIHPQRPVFAQLDFNGLRDAIGSRRKMQHAIALRQGMLNRLGIIRHAIADRAKPRHIAHGKKLPVRTGAVNGAGWSGLKPRDLASAVRVAVLVDAEGVQVREPEVGQGCAAVAVDVLALPETSGATAGDDDG